MKTGFNNDRYISLQSEKIAERIAAFGGKLYLEFGGKLFDDHHAARVLPGFLPDSKIKMLLELKDEAEVVIAINADDIEKSKVRDDLDIPYDLDVLRLIDAFRDYGMLVKNVVLTQYTGQPAATAFQARLQSLGVQVYCHAMIAGYPTDIDRIVSDDGYGKNPYIETERPLVIVTGPGPGSGKMAVCLSQLYHAGKRGQEAGYAKFETFPVWNLSLKHPVNLAYEAATADIRDVNMIDPFHLEAYGERAVNYNRDVEIFPLLSEILTRISKDVRYRSPTDMGVNMAGECIFDNDVVEEAAKQEIIRRYYTAACRQKVGLTAEDEVFRIELIMKQAGITAADRAVIAVALQKEEETEEPAAALQLPSGKIVTGKTSNLLGSSSALLLNALKELAHISDEIHLLSPIVIEPLQNLKVTHLGGINPRLHTDEVLVALAISAATNPTVQCALSKLKDLRGCEAHTTVMLSQADMGTFRKLGINVTSEPKYQTNKLYQGR